MWMLPLTATLHLLHKKKIVQTKMSDLVLPLCNGAFIINYHVLKLPQQG